MCVRVSVSLPMCVCVCRLSDRLGKLLHKRAYRHTKMVEFQQKEWKLAFLVS